jgi:hypothetical protein
MVPSRGVTAAPVSFVHSPLGVKGPLLEMASTVVLMADSSMHKIGPALASGRVWVSIDAVGKDADDRESGLNVPLLLTVHSNQMVEIPCQLLVMKLDTAMATSI